MIIHSGGALGADKLFLDLAIIVKAEYRGYYYGEKSEHNAPYGNVQITEQDYQEGKLMAALAAKYNWGYQYKTMKDPRLCRNWSQVKYSDQIIALGRLVNIGGRVFPNQPNDTRLAINPCVQGGTGYAITMALLTKKPVYIFDMNLNQWCTYQDNQWVFCNRPKLTENFAGIGSRQVTETAYKEIIELFREHFKR